MKTTINLQEAVNRIFDCDYDADDYNPEGDMFDYAQQILEEFPWEEIFQCAVAYFKEHSGTLDQVLNFIDLYVGNYFIDKPIDRPYEFAALIASKVDFDADWAKGADRVDGFLVYMLMGMVQSAYLSPPTMNSAKILSSWPRLRSSVRPTTSISEVKSPACVKAGWVLARQIGGNK